VQGAVAAMRPGRWLVAASGGRDSMTLLHALLAARPAEVVAVATVDHGTGAAARQGVALVEEACARAGVRCLVGRVDRRTAATEAGWREARWRFLRASAAQVAGVPVTAHTRDDQAETVVQRLLRMAGPRGLAGMSRSDAAAPAPATAIVRPLLQVPRATVETYATRHGVAFVEDPSNASVRFQRNRVRHELLPALERAHPGFTAWCLELSRRAADWRAEVDVVVDALGVSQPSPDVVVLPVPAVAACDVGAWEQLWPAITARVGIVLDRRGILRAARWAPTARVGQRIPVSGGHRIERTARTFIVRRGAEASGTSVWSEDYIEG